MSSPDDVGQAKPARDRRRWIGLLAAVVLVAAIVSWMVLHRTSADEPAAGLTAGWGGREDHPSCVYASNRHTVTCKIIIQGSASRRRTVTVKVTAYADENTSEPVGSATKSVRVEGVVHVPVFVTIPVEGIPHVDEDGETACRLSVKY